ncbi:MAG: hypothetical protein ACXACU_15840 [Candidatus Hodarchaeales archaeon]|jgi:hypothetical protein
MPKIIIRCLQCDDTAEVDDYNPYTGLYHDAAMSYICHCRGEMIQEKNEIQNDWAVWWDCNKEYND